MAAVALMMLVVVEPVSMGEDLALDPLSRCSHKGVGRVHHRLDNLKTVAVQSPHVIHLPYTLRVSFHAFALSAS